MCLCVGSATVILLEPCKWCQSESTCIYVNYCKLILRIHVTSPILGERISAITLTQQRKQWLSVELNRWRSEKIYCYF